ncbi:MAG: endolytic transglycosylase MltG [Microlunatus sp.]|nr:endolytic transglycosylase MltG [Microlunatus sp.]MDN5770745.1 endolytic transglycosylase MltG [Microlunatus sp.]
MLDPDLKPSPAHEIVHKGKGCLAVIVAAAVLLVGGYLVYDRATGLIEGWGEVADYPGPGKASVTVTVPDGATVNEIGSILVENKVVQSDAAWDEAVRSEARATSIQPGRYLMRTEMRAIDALTLLINPGESRVRSQFTVQEGLRLSAQVDVLVKETEIKKSAYEKALDKPKKLGLPKYAKNRPEGFLFPDTYELTEQATATSVLKMMTARFNDVADQIDLEASAKKLGRSPYDLVIVASIIEKEVRADGDRAKVARVIYNRLDAGEPLGLDSTVIYAKKLKTNTTTKKDRKSKSKYNTYRYEGLPPGPISAPGQAALEAAANPANGKWMYFVTVNFDTGETKFAVTPAEHEKNVKEWQAWCKAKSGRCDS